jgi:2-iminobutanoate/2-iminopropanoate deaminase
MKKINPRELKTPSKSYSQGILVPNNSETLYITGQLSQNIEGDILYPNDPEKQTDIIFQNISYILNEAGMDISNLVKISIYFKNKSDIDKISEVRNKWLKNIKPASLMIQVSGFVKEGCCVEIEGIAIK